MEANRKACRLYLYRALGKPPEWRLPEKEMLVSDFLSWVVGVHAANGAPLKGCTVHAKPIIGVNVGAVLAVKPEGDSDQVTKLHCEGYGEININESHNIRYSLIGSTFEFLDNHTVHSCKISNTEEDDIFSVSKKYLKDHH
eukprot:5999977-Lingulodinium_polyedra.AAC.1